MAVVIRMKRTGRTNRPCYRISVSDRQSPRDGRTIETIGNYDPASPIPELRLTLDVERARHWVSVGAIPSDTVRSILKRAGIEVVKPKPARDRSGRKKVTAKRRTRLDQKAQLVARKAERRKARAKAKRKAAGAAAKA